MTTAKRIAMGCVLLPVFLVASCAGKMSFDAWRYELPGEILSSSAPPTQKLNSAVQVAETLDAYVQPRFEILRDRNFGAFRIVYRKHAGIVQLKVDTPQEKELIANVNAVRRDYVISLLHCAPKPESNATTVTPRLQMLYFNRKQIIRPFGGSSHSQSVNVAEEHELNFDKLEANAIDALPQLRKGKEYQTKDAKWTILMRPVLASKPECLNCHTDAKTGDTLGVMVYAVGSEKTAPTPKVSLK